MNIGIIGGGIFGITTAWMLARDGHRVTLFEKQRDLMQAASHINQYRLHRGYHYPRSAETIQATQAGVVSFIREYADTIIKDELEHIYAIPKAGSYLSADEIVDRWQQHGLTYEEIQTDLIDQNVIAKTLRVSEDTINPEKLREISLQRLKDAGVSIQLGQPVELDDLQNVDQVIVATYANNNQLLKKFPHAQKEFQYELCEKIVVEMPQTFRGKSIVVADGPFMCIDPYGTTGCHLMGNVVHAVHTKNIGTAPLFSKEYVPLLNAGVIKNPPITNAAKFLMHAAEYIPAARHAKHIGSMFTIRTKPAHREHDDARPTTVERVTDNVIAVYSGKITNCVDAAEQILAMLK